MSERIAALLNMLASDFEGEQVNAARLLKAMAAKEKKTVAQLCMTGPTVYVEKVVYKEGAPGRGAPRDDIWEAMRRSQEARQRQREQERAERAEAGKRAYHGAFDDAEMSDAEREAARARRAKGKAFRGRQLLDELNWAYENYEPGDLSNWEIEFASSIPNQYTHDVDLSRRQEDVSRRIINKVKRNKEESPI